MLFPSGLSDDPVLDPVLIGYEINYLRVKFCYLLHCMVLHDCVWDKERNGLISSPSLCSRYLPCPSVFSRHYMN